MSRTMAGAVMVLPALSNPLISQGFCIHDHNLPIVTILFMSEWFSEWRCDADCCSMADCSLMGAYQIQVGCEITLKNNTDCFCQFLLIKK